MSAWCSAPDVLPSTPCVMHVYSRRYSRITLGVMQGWELPVPWYQVIQCCVAYDMYVICFSQLYVVLLVSCGLTHLHTSCKLSKLICIISVSSTVASGTQSLLTGTQLLPLCSRLSVLSLTWLPNCCGCCGMWWRLLRDQCYLF